MATENRELTSGVQKMVVEAWRQGVRDISEMLTKPNVGNKTTVVEVTCRGGAMKTELALPWLEEVLRSMGFKVEHLSADPEQKQNIMLQTPDRIILSDLWINPGEIEPNTREPTFLFVDEHGMDPSDEKWKDFIGQIKENFQGIVWLPPTARTEEERQELLKKYRSAFNEEKFNVRVYTPPLNWGLNINNSRKYLKERSGDRESRLQKEILEAVLDVGAVTPKLLSLLEESLDDPRLLDRELEIYSRRYTNINEYQVIREILDKRKKAGSR